MAESRIVGKLLLQGRKKIASTFGVKPAKVTEWVMAGAPLIFEGGKLQCDYDRMCAWFEENRSAKDYMLKKGFFAKTCQEGPKGSPSGSLGVPCEKSQKSRGTVPPKMQGGNNG